MSYNSWRFVLRHGAMIIIAGMMTSCAAQPLASASRLPNDVARFIDRREACDHFRGEEPYDAARAAEIDRNERNYCIGTDADLAQLKRKYSRQPAVQAALARYDPMIE